MARDNSPNYLGGWGMRIPWAQELEDAVSYNYTSVPQSKTLSQGGKKSRNFKPFFIGYKFEYLYLNNAEWVELLLYLESSDKEFL